MVRWPLFSTFFHPSKKCHCLLSKIANVFCCSIFKRLTEHTLKCCCLCLLATVCYFITFWPRLQSLPTLVHAEKFACFEFVAVKKYLIFWGTAILGTSLLMLLTCVVSCSILEPSKQVMFCFSRFDPSHFV